MNDQRSLTDQLRDAVRLCNEAGMYDAADWIKARLDAADTRAQLREIGVERLTISGRSGVVEIDTSERRAAGGIVDDAAVASGEGTGL